MVKVIVPSSLSRLDSKVGCNDPHRRRRSESFSERTRTGRIAYSLLFLTALSFAAQPTMYRPIGLPLSLLLVVAFNLSWFILELRINFGKLLLLLAFTAFLVLTDVLFGVGSRGSVLAVLMIFVSFGSHLSLSESDLLKIWKALTWVGLFLALLGTHRYLNGYIAPLSENEGGIISIGEEYFYLGIGYLPATRNSDAFYFALGLVAAMRVALSSAKCSLLYLAISFFQAGVIVLTLSRGIYVASLLAVYFILSSDQKNKGAAVLALSAITFSLLPLGWSQFSNQMDFVSKLVGNAVVSIFDVASANQNVQGYYTYSNNSRTDLYIATFHNFLSWPLGQGIDNPYVVNANKETSRLHSENLFLDFLIIFGVFSIIPLFYVSKLFFLMIKLRREFFPARVSISVMSLCIVYALVNSPVDLVIFWFAIVLSLAEANNATQLVQGRK